MLPAVGTHPAKATEITVYESKAGALMCALRCAVDEQTSIISHQCLVQKDGTPNQRTIDTLKEVFGWDGADPFWLADNDLSAVEFSIVVEPDNYEGKDTVRVAWINPKGGGPGTLQKGDRAAILAKYGAKFRALAGPQPVKPAAAPKKAAPPPPPQPDTRESRYGVSSQEAAWRAVCNRTPDVDQDKRAAAWHTAIASLFPGKTQSDLTPEQWGEVASKAPDMVAKATDELKF